MSWLVASDLDRTLIYSRAAMELGGPVADPVCVEHYDGAENSFISPVALAGLADLSQQVPFVPTTTRTAAQYLRVRLPGVRIAAAVTTNGGAILIDERPCPDWQLEVDRRLTDVASFAAAGATLQPLLAQPWTLRIRSAEDRFWYAVMERGAVPDQWLGEVSAAIAELGWVTSLQGRKMYFIPAPLTKEAALAEVAQRLGCARVVAAGDSLLDRGLLEYAEVGVRPAHGELADTGWLGAGVRATSKAGGRAAEEIIDIFSRYAR